MTTTAQLKFGILGSGSWGTALVKILTDNGHSVSWWIRSTSAIEAMRSKKHNPHYLPQARLETDRITWSTVAEEVVSASDVVIIAIPSAYVTEVLDSLPASAFQGRQVLSAIKGILPGQNRLLNEYLQERFGLPLEQYFALLGPCHAEEVAAEKLSYLTCSGIDPVRAAVLAGHLRSSYIRTVVNTDVLGVQYASVLKNIYALGAGIALGLDYGDNFLSVLIANSADEMARFLRKAGIVNAEVGYLEAGANGQDHHNYAASVYLGDLLVTCYSPYSRNRRFGTMIGKGYSVKAAQLEMNMVAEGFPASRCIHDINTTIGVALPIAETVYRILWQEESPAEGFSRLESSLM